MNHPVYVLQLYILYYIKVISNIYYLALFYGRVCIGAYIETGDDY